MHFYPTLLGISLSRICAQYCPPNSCGGPTIIFVSKNVQMAFMETDQPGNACNNVILALLEITSKTYVPPLVRVTLPISETLETCSKRHAYCVYSCRNKLYADAAHNRECHPTFWLTFSDNSTMECVSLCIIDLQAKEQKVCEDLSNYL